MHDGGVHAERHVVHEDTTVELADIDDPTAGTREERRDIAKPPGVAKAAREIVAGPDRIEGQRRRRAHEAVRDLVGGAVAAGRDDRRVPIVCRLGRESRGFCRRRCDEHLDPHARVAENGSQRGRELPALPVAGLRIEDRDRIRGAALGHWRAARIACCSSSESVCFDRPSVTVFAKIRVSARPCKLEIRMPVPPSSSSAIAND